MDAVLEGSKITAVTAVYCDDRFDYWNIETETYKMGIYYKVSYTDSHGRTCEFGDVLDSLVGKIIQTVEGEGRSIAFGLDDGSILSILLDHADNRGPEAAAIYFVSGAIMVLQEDEF